MTAVRRWLPAAAGLLLLLWYLRPPPATPVEDYHIAMGTMVRMTLYVDEARSTQLVEVGRKAIADIESVTSHYDSSSELSRINRSAAVGPVDVTPQMADLLNRMWRRAEQTDGRFDPALGALTAVWGFPDALAPPEPAQVDESRLRSGMSLVEWHADQIYFRHQGVRLDLGAAAKGYAVDHAVDRLQEAGVAAGMIEAGGDIRFWGVKPDGRPWRFGVQHPRHADRIIVVDDLGLPALATSGDYEQVFEFEGIRYHHLLDPQTGYPARRAVSATAWATTAAAADMLATAAFVGGPEAALAMAAEDDSLEVLVFFEEEGRLERVASKGVRVHMQGDEEDAHVVSRE
ncbi:MAG: FAD:protein FMN transferase [Gemmatimonadetes bacterium]|nr:FAD:protein FMN transferase [Gemmatimonadota bacterium]